MPLLETKGAASAQGFGGAGAGSSGPVNYIEDVFSTYLYTGNGSTQTITNGIDLSTKGGLVWAKRRDNATQHILADTAQGAGKYLSSNSSAGTTTNSFGITSFTSSGFGMSSGDGQINATNATYVSWTFREQPKFFDVVTYTGDGSNRTISHNLGSVPGCIIVKRTDAAADWQVYHRSLANTEYLVLNTTAAKATGTTRWNSTTPTSTVFSLGTDTTVNANGGTYVAYLFAHDAGGFGLTGTDNVISCGSVTNSGGSQYNDVSLGWEPQWLLVKNATGTSTTYWQIVDNMRGLTNNNVSTAVCNTLQANAANAESNPGNLQITATGFRYYGTSYNNGDTLIYIAIRRGPMKTPTSGTSVFSPNAVADDSSAITTNFPVDGYWEAVRTGNPNNFVQQSRLTGGGQYLTTSSTAAENNTGFTTVFQNNTGYTPGTFGSSSLISYAYRRAPGFFDVVCYTGTGSNTTQTHNLGVVPELIIVKRRDTTGAWDTYSAALSNTEYLVVNTTAAKATGATRWNSTTPTSTVFSLGTSTTTNASGGTYVAYLFATCAGVSKVGTYTGTGALQTINCGFTGGARFVLIKRTDSTGDWYVYDSARGISSGNDPYLLLNSTAAEVTGTNYVDTTSVGFQVTAAAPAGLNANGGSFVFLAIA